MKNHNVCLAIGYDTEQAVPEVLPKHIIKPGDYQKLPTQGRKDVWTDYLWNKIWNDPEHLQRSLQELDTTKKLGQLFSEHNARFTSFVLGKWLDFIVESAGLETVRASFLQSSIDVQSHSYTHHSYKDFPDRERRRMAPTVDQDKVYQKIEKGNKTIEKHLNITPIGLRPPMGNIAPLNKKEDLVILEALKANGMKYICSHMKSGKTEPNPISVQPFAYTSEEYPEVMEIPANGYFDVHHTQPTRFLVFDDEKTNWTPKQFFGYYAGLLNQALEINKKTKNKTPFFVTLVHHPWAVSQYDPNLDYHKSLLEFCKQKKIKIISLTDVYNLCRK